MTLEPTPLRRLKDRAEFLYVRDGRYAARPTLVVQARQNPKSPNDIGVGFTATKKTGNAVTRNRAKRRMRALAHEFLRQNGKVGFDYVLIARHSTAKAPWQSLCQDIEKALSRLT